MTWTDIENEVRRLRRCGVVVMKALSRPAGESLNDVADRVAESVGYKALGPHRVRLDRDGTTRVLTRVLAQDLAYDSSIMTSEDADRLAQAFLAHVGTGAAYVTNGTWADGAWAEPPRRSGSGATGLSWKPLSKATFDAGVLAVGEQVAAILWVEDED
jgi:hypothetical protein